MRDISLARFLHDRGALENFVFGVRMGPRYIERDTAPKDWIALAFEWDQSSQGLDYWMDLSREWARLVEASDKADGYQVLDVPVSWNDLEEWPTEELAVRLRCQDIIKDLD